MRLGTGVTVAGTRIAPVTAAAIATINRLAPGRTFIAIGTGHTGYRMMGQRPLSVAAFEEYVRVVAALVRGEEVEYTGRGQAAALQLQMPELGFVDVEHPIPVYVGASGPRTRAVAGRHGDGLIGLVPGVSGAEVSGAIDEVEQAARAAGRPFDRSSFGAVMPIGDPIVLEPGEDLTSDRVKRRAGVGAIAILHYVYSAVCESGDDPAEATHLPPFVEPFWQEYCACLAATDARTRHLRMHAGHYTYVHPDEWRFVTPELIAATGLVGRAEEVVDQLRTYADAGVTDFLLLPALEHMYVAIEEFSRRVLAKL